MPTETSIWPRPAPASRRIRANSSSRQSLPSSTPGTHRVPRSTASSAASPTSAGTAANVMQMVFGNRDAHSATGVCFSRDPATGQPGLYGEFLFSAQGEDIVAGTRDARAGRSNASSAARRLRRARGRGRKPRNALPRRAGCRVHGRKRPAAYLADAVRQANRNCGAARGGRHDRRRLARHAPTRSNASTLANSSSFCIRRSILTRNSSPIAIGLSCLARCGLGACRLRRRHGRRAGRRRERLARQARDDGGRHPRPARGAKASSLRGAG